MARGNIKITRELVGNSIRQGVAASAVSFPRKVTPASGRELNKEMYRNFQDLWMHALGVFILTALKHIKVDTGMSAASLIPLASAESGHRRMRMGKTVRQRIRDLRRAVTRPGHTDAHLRGFLDNDRKVKSMRIGEEIGKAAFTFELGSLGTPQLDFSFRIPILQYHIHENPATGQGWQSLPAATSAFKAYISANFKRYVGISTIFTWIATGEVVPNRWRGLGSII